MHGRTRRNQRQGDRFGPILDTVQNLSLSHAGAGHTLTRSFRMPVLVADSIGTLIRVLLFVLIAAHVAHIPVLAHGAHEGVDEQVGHHKIEGQSGIGRGHTIHATLPNQETHGVRLTGTGAPDVECMTTAATIPARAASLDAIAASATIPDCTRADSFSPTAIQAAPTEATRRHLLLQVLQR